MAVKTRIEEMIFTKAAKSIMILGGLYPVKSKRLQSFINGVLIFGVTGSFFAAFAQSAYVIRNVKVAHIDRLCTSAFLALWTFTQSYVLLAVIIRRDDFSCYARFIVKTYLEKEYNDFEILELEACNRKCCLFAIAYGLSSAICYSAFVGIPILEMKIKNSTIREFPFPAAYEFPHLYDTPIYETYYVIQVAGTVGVWLMENTMNFYSVFLLVFAATQFKLLRQKILRITITTDEDLSRISRKIKRCMIDHKLIIRYVDEDNRCYSTVYLICAAFNVANTCVCLYLFVSVSDSIYFIIENTARLSVMLLNSFGTCTAAQHLIDQSEALDYAIYQVSMQLLSSRRYEKRQIIQILSIMHVRAQKPSCITLKFIGQASISSFKAMMRASYSYFTLLRQMNE